MGLAKNVNFHITIIVLLVIGIIVAGILIPFPDAQSEIYSEGKPVIVTPDNLPSYLSSFAFIKDLPRKSSIQLVFGDEEYKITRGEVMRGKAENPDVIIKLPNNYVIMLGSGVCGTLQEAIKKGDLEYDVFLSKAELLWKYKKMLKYKDCAGF